MRTHSDFVDAYKAYNLSIRQLAGAAQALPTYKFDHLDKEGNPCGWEPDPDGGDSIIVSIAEGVVETAGLSQICRFYGAGVDGESDPHAETDGWDDMGDMDGPSWIVCDGCGQAFQVPLGLDWD